MRIFLSILLGGVFLFFACNISKEQNNSDDSLSLSEDFNTFYKDFHKDSIFQSNHITFPLLVSTGLLDSLHKDKPILWQKEDWTYQPGIDLGDTYTREFVLIGDDVVVENIKHKKVKYMMQRRFAIIAGEWNLIYFRKMGAYE